MNIEIIDLGNELLNRRGQSVDKIVILFFCINK